MIDGNSLAVNKAHFGSGLDSCEILILAHIEEFERNGCLCYLTNEQMAEMFGEALSKIKRRLNALEDKGRIVRKTIFVPEINKNRRVFCTAKDSMKIILKQAQNTEDTGSKIEEERFKTNVEEVHNEPIKENLKENQKENLKDNNNNTKNEYSDVESIGSPERKRNNKKYRTIHDLEIEEGDDIADSVKYGLDTYVNLQREYNLEFGSVTKEFVKQWQEEKRRRGGGMSIDDDLSKTYISEKERQENRDFVAEMIKSMQGEADEEQDDL